MESDLFQVSLLHLTSAQRYNGGGLSNSVLQSGPDLWQTERPADMAKIVDLEVMCGKEHMEVQVSFDRPFNGIIFSKVRERTTYLNDPMNLYFWKNRNLDWLKI